MLFNLVSVWYSSRRTIERTMCEFRNVFVVQKTTLVNVYKCSYFSGFLVSWRRLVWSVVVFCFRHPGPCKIAARTATPRIATLRRCQRQPIRDRSAFCECWSKDVGSGFDNLLLSAPITRARWFACTPVHAHLDHILAPVNTLRSRTGFFSRTIGWRGSPSTRRSLPAVVGGQGGWGLRTHTQSNGRTLHNVGVDELVRSGRKRNRQRNWRNIGGTGSQAR